MSVGRPLDSRVDQEEQLGARLLDTDVRLTRLERQSAAAAIYESIFVVDSFGDLPEPQPGMFGSVLSESQWYAESNGSWVVSSNPIPEQNDLGFRNGINTAWATLGAGAFNISADLAYKSRVRRGREEHHPYLEGVLTGDRQLAFDKHRGVETIVYDDAQMVAKEHHCDDFDCGGTNESPCWLVEQHVDSPGFSAQNLQEFYPKVVSKDMNGDNFGANIYGIVAELWNTVDHLIAECEDLRAALGKVEGASVPPRPRGGSVLPVEPFRKGTRVTQ